MSKLCRDLLEESPQLVFSHTLKVNLPKEHCNRAFLFGNLFFFFNVVDAYHLEINFCVSIVRSRRAGRGSWCWQLRAAQLVLEEACGDAAQLFGNDEVKIVAL